MVRGCNSGLGGLGIIHISIINEVEEDVGMEGDVVRGALVACSPGASARVCLSVCLSLFVYVCMCACVCACACVHV